jgi:hypothetical protein
MIGVTTPLRGVRFPHRPIGRWFSRKIAERAGAGLSGSLLHFHSSTAEYFSRLQRTVPAHKRFRFVLESPL